MGIKCVLTVLMQSILCIGAVLSQGGDIHIINPSFEGEPRKGEYILVLKGWSDCGMMHFRGETPPDVLPVEDGWQNSTEPIHGNTFLGMVVRDNDTWEAISQQLESPIQADSTYQFSIALMQSEKYISPSRLNPEKKVNFQRPVKLRIWGGDSHCNAVELLAVSPLVFNRDWQKYVFDLKPSLSHSHFIMEAMYDSPNTAPYNGHILLDMASPLRKISK